MADNRQNPRNPDSQLFKKLTRMFSGPLTQRRSQNYRKLRRKHLNVYSNRFKSLSGQSFKKQGYSPFQNLQTQRIQNQNRAERYREFDQMEFTPEIASAMDMYADEMTTSTAISPALKINCHNEEIKTILENLYYNILNVEHNLFYWCRTMCKYGDFFLYADIDEDHGITSTIGIPPEEIERLEGEDKTNPNYIQFQWNSAGITFENWQILHFRILGHDRYAPYGTSILDPCRRAWRQLLLIEDSVMAYRIVRSPERRVFYIDVGSIPAQDVEQFMEQVITQMKRHTIVDEDTGRVDLRYNPLSVDEDYYIPVRGESQTRVDTLQGGQYTGDIEDVQYLQNKVFAGLKIPRSYLIVDENSSEDKESLSQKDIHFARTIWRLQRPVISELEKAGIIHLILNGFPEEDALSFSLELNNPSKVSELQELETLRTRVDVANALTEQFFSRRYAYQKVFNVSEREYQRLEREVKQDASFRAALAQIEEGGEGLGGDLGGDLGLGDDLGGDIDLGAGEDDTGLDMGDDLGDDLGGGTEDEELDDGTLLAAPGKRDETTTPKSKGKKYRPVSHDRRSMGARHRSMKGKYSHEKSRNTKRNTFNGLNSIMSFENLINNYNERKQLFDSNQGPNKSKLIESVKEFAAKNKDKSENSEDDNS